MNGIGEKGLRVNDCENPLDDLTAEKFRTNPSLAANYLHYQLYYYNNWYLHWKKCLQVKKNNSFCRKKSNSSGTVTELSKQSVTVLSIQGTVILII